MKKLFKSILLVTLAIMVAFTFVGCSSNFLSEGKIKTLGKKLGLEKTADGKFVNPTATITINCTNVEAGGNYEVTLVYELLFDKAPITVNNFIYLVQNKFYDDTLMDTVNSSYSVLGRYFLNDSNTYEAKEYKYTIKGEFISNGWSVDGSEDGAANAVHELGSLGMYHKPQSDTVNYFDSASTGFYIAWSNSFGSNDTIQNKNYAVFGKIVESKVKFVGGDALSESFYADDTFRPGIDSEFVRYITNINTTTRKDSTGEITLSETPSSTVKIKGVTLNGVKGDADKTLRKKA